MNRKRRNPRLNPQVNPKLNDRLKHRLKQVQRFAQARSPYLSQHYPFYFFWFLRHCTPATLRRAIAAAAQQRLTGLAAEMAYNAMLSFFPSILAILTAIGLFEPLKQTFLRLAVQLGSIAPVEALGIIDSVAQTLSTTRNGNLFSFSFLFALWSSSAALSAAMTALDQIHQIPVEKQRSFWKSRFIAVVLTIGALILLLVALALIGVSELTLQLLAQHSDTLQQGLLTYSWLLTLPLALGIISMMFAFIYRFGPSCRTPGKPVLPGAILAAGGWAVLSNLLRFFVLQVGNYNQIYGAIGAVIVLLLWLYMTSLVLLLGDQLNVTVAEAMQQSATSQSRPL